MPAGRPSASLGRAFLMKPRHNKLLGRFSGLVLMGGGVWLSLVRTSAGVNQFSLSVVTRRTFGLPKGVPTQRR